MWGAHCHLRMYLDKEMYRVDTQNSVPDTLLAMVLIFTEFESLGADVRNPSAAVQRVGSAI